MDRTTDSPTSRQRNMHGVLTLQQAADVLGISRRNAETAEQRALRKLRNHPLMRRLAEEMGIVEADR